MSAYAWNPPDEWIANAHATALARTLGVEGYDELLALSTAQPEVFWDAVVRDLGIPFEAPYERVLDVSRGPAWARWFVGGKLNLAHACVERWADDPAHAQVEAIAWEDEAGATRSLTYAELAFEVARCAEGLEAIGVRNGDAVALLMPMAPEVAIAYYAIASLGALVVPIFSGFSASAVASRLEDSRAVALITVDAFMRRGRPVPAKATADEAAARSPGVRHVIVVRHTGASSSTAGPGRGARRPSTASTRSCSPTPRARRAGPRERCTSTAASSSRWRARAATPATSSPATGCTG
jgi:acetyl-CoA synthetase